MMSSNEDLYWKSLNTMLRNDEIDFSSVISENEDSSVLLLTYKNSEHLKKGIQYALDNPNVIAKFEYDFNNGQPVKITEKHINRAKAFIQSGFKPELIGLSTVLNACSDVAIDDFLLECYVLAQRKQADYRILTDGKRKMLISNIFGTEFSEEVSTRSVSESKYDGHDISCTQIIFDSADFESALDELVINLSDRTWSSWRIQSVYIQESLKNAVYDSLTKDRLNATNNISGVVASQIDVRTNIELAKEYGGRFLSNDNNTICLMFDVPRKYLTDTINKPYHQIPVAVNFFRTTKELIQLMKSDYSASKKHLTSIWTENIGLFYEVGAEINSDIIWSNSIGLFDGNMPLLNSNLALKDHDIRFALNAFNIILIFNGVYLLLFQCGFNTKYQSKICRSYSQWFNENTKISLHSIWQNICKLISVFIILNLLNTKF